MEQQITNDFREYNFLFCEVPELYHEAAGKAGLSDSVMNILFTLCVFGKDCTQSNISRLTGLPRQTIHSAIRKLEEDGILYLEEVSRKVKTIHLTEKGQALLSDKVEPIVRAEQAVMEGWSAEDRKALITLTRRYYNDFKRNLNREDLI